MKINWMKVLIVMISMLGLGLLAHLTNFTGMVRRLHGS
jgi:hypothetical protein